MGEGEREEGQGRRKGEAPREPLAVSVSHPQLAATNRCSCRRCPPAPRLCVKLHSSQLSLPPSERHRRKAKEGSSRIRACDGPERKGEGGEVGREKRKNKKNQPP